jgi:hypothetical protein
MPRLLGSRVALAGAAARAPSPAVLLALELGDRQNPRLGHGELESLEQPVGAQEPDDGSHLRGLAALDALERRPADARRVGHLVLREVPLDAVALEPVPELSENGGVGHEGI